MLEKVKNVLGTLRHLRMDDSEKQLSFWGAIFFLMLLKYGYYGVRYFPVVDDNNMYGAFSRFFPIDALMHYKNYTTRPFAALLDTFVLSRFWDSMWVSLLFITILHFLCCYLVWKVLKSNGIQMGVLTILLFTLSPYSTDATYWIAASSRIVVGLFFIALSLYLLQKYIDHPQEQSKKGMAWIVLFFLVNLVSMGFYEQVTVLAFVCPLILMVANFKRLRHKWMLLLPFINTAAIGYYYQYFSNVGYFAARNQRVKGDYLEHTLEVFRSFFDSLFREQFVMVKNGFVRGMELMLNDSAWLMLVLMLVLSVFVALLIRRSGAAEGVKSNLIKLILGLVLLVAPLGPFFVLETIWICNRNIFVSFLGFGLIVEAIFSPFLTRWDQSRWVGGCLAAALTFIFMAGNVSELTDYRNVSVIDREIIHRYVDTFSPTKYELIGKSGTVVFNTRHLYTDVTLEHFSNCTASDWAFTGAINVIRQGNETGYTLPVKNGGTVTMSVNRLKNCLYMGMDDNRNFFPLTGEWVEDDVLMLHLDNGALFGSVKKAAGGWLYFELAH